MKKQNYYACIIGLFVSTILLTSCSGVKTDSPIYDPLEKYNRYSLKANDQLDKIIVEPLAKGYRAVTPEAGRTVIRNFLRNLNSPVIIGNELLQGDLKGAHDATCLLYTSPSPRDRG